MGTAFVAILLAVIFVLAFRATAKEMKRGGCAYCASAAKTAKQGTASNQCPGNCAHCSGCQH